MIKLNTILREDSNSSIDSRINYLIQLGIEKAYGVYFITLPETAYSAHQIGYMMKGFDKRAMIGYYPAVFKSGLSIHTNIKI